MSYDAVFLSPHLDDAAYSCGGTIKGLTSANQKVLVLTFTTKEPDLNTLSAFAQHHHDRWPTQSGLSMIETRKTEDLAALNLLGAEYTHAQFLDCIYRSDGAGNYLYQNEEELFGDVNPADAPALEDFVNLIKQTLTEPKETLLFCPLAVGNHVDHQLVRDAVLTLCDTGTLSKDKTLFYEDYPYHEQEQSVPDQSSNQWRESLWQTTESENNIRIEAIAKYDSQFLDFWQSKDDLANNLARRWQGYGHAERYWQLN